MNAFDLAVSYAGFALDARATWDTTRTALFGASGSGKTTILEAMAGVRRDVRGRVELAGRRVDALPARRRRVGWVPQEGALFPHLTVRANVAFGAGRADPRPMQRAIDALEIGTLLDRPVAGLSGGERQRVAIARALACDPCFLLLDEPLASIDRPLRARVLPFIRDVPQRTGVPMLVVSHDPLEAVALTEHVLILERGRIVAAGAPRAVFASAVAFGDPLALEAENAFAGRVVGHEDGMLLFQTDGGCRVAMAWVAGFPEPSRVAVRAEDVLLAVGPPAGISAQNVLAGSVEHVTSEAGHVTVAVRSGGETWRARVTERAARALALEPGRAIWLVFKAHSVQPLA